MKLTVADIARMSGVSKATVSRVLNGHPEGASDQTRARILGIIRDTGFRPSGSARCLATGKSRSVGLIIPDITNPFHPLLVRGAEDVFNKAGYSLFLCNSDSDLDKENRYVQVLLEKGVDGVILNSAASDCDCQLDLLDAKAVPYVILDRMIEGERAVHGVFVDNRAGARLAVRELLNRDDCRLLYLNGPAAHSQSRLRRAGLEDALGEAGLALESVVVLHGDYSIASGAHLVEELLRSADWPAGKLPFNAVFACNDLMAIGAMRALRQHDIVVPDEVGIIGFDDIGMAQLMEPPLSTVSQPSFEMGACSAEMLLQLIAGQEPPERTITLMPKLVLRGTNQVTSHSRE